MTSFGLQTRGSCGISGRGGRFDTQRKIARYPIPTPAVRGANRVVGVYMRGFFDRGSGIRNAPPSQHDLRGSRVTQAFRSVVDWPEWLMTQWEGNAYAAKHSKNYRSHEFGRDDKDEWRMGVMGR